MNIHLNSRSGSLSSENRRLYHNTGGYSTENFPKVYVIHPHFSDDDTEARKGR